MTIAPHKTTGAVYTKPEVVEFILDLIGYTSDQNLVESTFLEPSFGEGSFLIEAAQRLLESWNGLSPENLMNCIRGFEINHESLFNVCEQLNALFGKYGIDPSTSQRITNAWLIEEDFLLAPLPHKFNYIAGNPPYVRPENIEPVKLTYYRSVFTSMTGRADLYIPFMQKALTSLIDAGSMSLICADAWVRNDFGKGIRKFISECYSLEAYIDMYGLDAFETGVGAYPSITLITRKPQTVDTAVVTAQSVDRECLNKLSAQILSNSDSIHRYKNVVKGSAPWHVSTNSSYSVIDYLEQHFPTLFEAGCKVGIGVATGADKVFIADKDIDIEEDRKLPLVTNKCVHGSHIDWTHKVLVNPWDSTGKLIDLGLYPKTKKYLEAYKEQLVKRHTAKSNPELKWYKTIDKVSETLCTESKILVPDVKNPASAFTLDQGDYYPHHNLYYITAAEWDLTALFALLRSGIARMFVEAYSVKLGGGFVRYQAQYLKRIRVPLWSSLTAEQQDSLINAGREYRVLDTEFMEELYNLDPGMLSFMKENNDGC